MFISFVYLNNNCFSQSPLRPVKHNQSTVPSKAFHVSPRMIPVVSDFLHLGPWASISNWYFMESPNPKSPKSGQPTWPVPASCFSGKHGVARTIHRVKIQLEWSAVCDDYHTRYPWARFYVSVTESPRNLAPTWRPRLRHNRNAIRSNSEQIDCLIYTFHLSKILIVSTEREMFPFRSSWQWVCKRWSYRMTAQHLLSWQRGYPPVCCGLTKSYQMP